MYSKPASECSWEELSKLVNASFEGYIGTVVNLSPAEIEAWFPPNLVDATVSHVFYPDEGTEPVAFAILSVRDDRPGEVRLTSMGVVPTFQGKGTGTTVLQKVIEAETARGTRLLELECIQQNERGMKLYTRAGFTKYKEMMGWQTTRESSKLPATDPELQQCSVEDVDAVLQAHGSRDLPWQAGCMAKLAKPGLGYRLGHAYCAITEPTDASDTILVYCFIVETEWRGKGQGKRLAEAMLAKYPDKKFKAKPIFPPESGEAFGKSLESLGVEAIGVRLWQMRLDLS